MNNNVKFSELITEALAHIPSQEYWCKRHAHRYDATLKHRQHCILGAFGMAHRGWAFFTVLEKLTPYVPGSITVAEFNDDPKTTYDDVRKWLLEVRAKYQAKEANQEAKELWAELVEAERLHHEPAEAPSVDSTVEVTK